MKRIVANLFCLALACTVLSCRAEHLQKDQAQFRGALLELYTDQIMDNLIRAHNRMPLIQLDYSDITGTITQDLNGTLSGSRENASGAITRALGLGVGGNNNIQLTVTANPVIDNPAIYDAYVDFVKKPDRLMVTCDEPTDEAAHIVRHCGNSYYWVPTKYRDEFHELALRTTAKRGDAVTAPDGFENKILGKVGAAKEIIKSTDGKWTQYEFQIRFHSEMPNDSGHFVLAVRGHVYRFNLVRLAPADGAPARTYVLLLRYTMGDDIAHGQVNIAPDELADELADRDVTIKLQNSRPVVQRPVSVGPAIRRETQLNRLDQRQRTP